MSVITTPDLLSPDEFQCEEIARRLEKLRSESTTLANEITHAIPLFREQGIPIPPALIEQYQAWCEKRSQSAEELNTFLGGASASEQTLPGWNRLLDRKRSELRAHRDRDAMKLYEIKEVLQRIEGLQVVKGEANTHAEVHDLSTLASSLLEKLGSPAERRVVLDDETTLDGMRSVLSLIDVPKGGTLDSDAEDQAVEAVESTFSRKLATALLRGRITTPVPKSVVLTDGVPTKFLSPDEATKRLTLGQTEAAPASVRSIAASTPPTTPPIQVDDLVLIGQRMQADVPGLYDAPSLSTAYEAVIQGIQSVEAVVKDPRYITDPSKYNAELTHTLFMLAALQSAMRAAAAPYEDERQVAVYRWLYQTAKEQSIFISRHMKIDDPADPAKFPEWVEQIHQFRRKWDSPRRVSKLLHKIQHELKKSLDDPDSWDAVFRGVEELTSAEKFPPSDVRLRETLMPHLDHLPSDISPPDSFQQVQRAIDEYQQTQEQRQAEAETPHGQQNPEVEELAQMLRGRAVVLIGGEVDPLAKSRLEKAFGLSELVWLAAHHEQSVERFAAPVQRPDVVLVMVVIRWMSHGHGDAKQYCDPLGKPFVRLLGTTNPNRVAHDVLSQCGDILRAKFGEATESRTAG